MSEEQQNPTESYKRTVEPSEHGPAGEVTTSEDWKDWIKQNLKDFEGNLDNAAKLMAEFTAGKNFILEGDKRVGLRTKRIGITILPKTGPLLPTLAAANPDGLYALVRQDILEYHSLMDIQKEQDIWREEPGIAAGQYRELIFYGSYLGYYGDVGAEEMGHCSLFQTGVILDPPDNALMLPMPEYDALPAEKATFPGRIEFARARGRSQRTIDHLLARQNAARMVSEHRQHDVGSTYYGQ